MANIMRIGGGGGEPNILTVAVDTGAVVTATNGGKTAMATSVGGKAILKLPEDGTWRIIATKDGQTAEDSIVIVDEYPVEVSFGLPLSSLAHGALVRLTENGKGVNFYLAKHDYESGLNGAGRSLLVRKDCHSNGQWSTWGYSEYSDSIIDNWLNDTYKPLLDSSVQNLIGTTKFYYSPGARSTKVTTIQRSVFILSLTEFGGSDTNANVLGSALPIASALQIAYLNGSATKQWTRTPSKQYTDSCYCLDESGAFSAFFSSNKYGYRPCFTLPAELMVNPTPNADGSYTLMV